jgi:cytochrome c oxidase subunit 2
MSDGLQSVRGMLMILCLVIFLLVFAVMFYSIWKHHRTGVGRKTNFHASVAVEICWALAPFVIVLALVWPTTKMMFSP